MCEYQWKCEWKWMKMSENHGESHWDNLEITVNITQYIICTMKVIVKDTWWLELQDLLIHRHLHLHRDIHSLLHCLGHSFTQQVIGYDIHWFTISLVLSLIHGFDHWHFHWSVHWSVHGSVHGSVHSCHISRLGSLFNASLIPLCPLHVWRSSHRW